MTGTSPPSGRKYFTTREAVAHTGLYVDTILHALRSGELHGYQRSFKCQWRIPLACLDAWMLGEPCEHQKQQRGRVA